MNMTCCEFIRPTPWITGCCNRRSRIAVVTTIEREHLMSVSMQASHTNCIFNPISASVCEEDFVKMSGLGDEEGEKKASDSADDGASIEVPETWLPIRWKRGMLFLVTAAEIFVIVILQNFSYSTIFTNIQYPFIVGYKLFQLVYDQGIRSILREVLLTAPLICAMQVSSVMMIQGAATFVDYVIAYSTSLIVLVASRIYSSA